MGYTYTRMDTEIQREKIVVELEALNEKIDRQMSIGRIFGTGVIYGVGFFIGSVIIASIAFSIFAPWVGQIDWIRDNFERGSTALSE